MRLDSELVLLGHVKDTPSKGKKIKSHGLSMTIEHPRGSVRVLHDDSGKQVYKTTMMHDYGFIDKTKGRDGDEVDVFHGPLANAPEVHIVHMLDKGPVKAEREDEDKCMMGFPSADAAKAAFLAHYPKEFYGGMTSLPTAEFKKRLKTAQLPYRKKKITAGGPGSGRHTESDAMFDYLSQHGFRPHASVGTIGEARNAMFNLDMDKSDPYYKPGLVHGSSHAWHVHRKGAHAVAVHHTSAKWEARSGETGQGLQSLQTHVDGIGAATPGHTCPKCGGKEISLMPTDFETAKCRGCGKTFEINAGGPGSGRHKSGPSWSPETPFGVRYAMFDKAGRSQVKQKYFSHDEDRSKHLEKVEQHPAYHETLAYDDPREGER